MKLEIDRERCVGAGQCVLAASDVFDQDDEGLVIVLEADPAPEHYEDVREASRVCPASVISVLD